MENAAKALTIAGGVLIAVIIIVSIVYVFNAMSQPQNEREAALQAEQLAAFNQEYEVYNKKLMYGVDVLSVLNKAYSNNKKNSGESNYQVEVCFELKNSDLEGSIEVYYQQEYNNNKTILKYQSGSDFTNLNASSDKGKSISDLVGKTIPDELLDGKNFDDYKLNEDLFNADESVLKCKIQAGRNYSSTTDKTLITSLIKAGVNYEKVNKDSDKYKELYKITVKTPAHDFKNRRFECTGVEYNKTSGRIEKISFKQK